MSAINKILDNLEEYFAIFSLIIASGLIFLNVILRYFFGMSLSWSGEASRYLIIWFIFIGGSLTAREREHAKVDVLTTYLPPKFKKTLSIIASVFAIIFCAFLIVSGIQVIQNIFAYPSLTPAMEIPMYIPYLAIPVGASLMLYRFLQNMIEDIKETPDNIDSDDKKTEVDHI